MGLEAIAFGLIHPLTMRFARYSEDEGCIIHRLNAEMTATTYRDESNELSDRAPILETGELKTILKLIASNEWGRAYPFTNEEPEEIDDFQGFVPVAFIRGKRRLAGIGDFYDAGTRIMLVTPKDASGTDYELSEMTTA